MFSKNEKLIVSATPLQKSKKKDIFSSGDKTIDLNTL